MNGEIKIPLATFDNMRNRIAELEKKQQEFILNEKYIRVCFRFYSFNPKHNYQDFNFSTYIKNIDEYKDKFDEVLKPYLDLVEESYGFKKHIRQLELKLENKKFKGILSFLNKYLPK